MIITVCVVIAVAGKILSRESKAAVLDSNGDIIAEISYGRGQLTYECEERYKSYVEIVCNEAVNKVMEKKQIPKKQAEREIVKNSLSIRTNCAKSICEHLGDIYEADQDIQGKKFGVAISDTRGQMIACYSNSLKEREKNYVTYPTFAGSTLKPISVYGYALEKNYINWSTMYMDDAYMQVEDQNGDLTGWPANTEPYTNQMVTVVDALKKSNNAVAVKVLDQAGAKNVCEFLKEKLEMKLDGELKNIESGDMQKALSSIALGYLQSGVSVQKMLENYQVFANGGELYPLYTINKIQDKEGKTVYEREEESKRVFSEETAYIVNRLMKHVVEEGTGTDAQIEGLDVCGKTGTSDGYKDNWFIGMTPEYVCAVWYSDDEAVHKKNKSVVVFKKIIQNLGCDKEVKYKIPDNIVEEEYCLKTGLRANGYCQDTQKGYYKKDSMPGTCACTLQGE